MSTANEVLPIYHLKLNRDFFLGMKVVYRFPAAQIFRFSFGQVSRTGNEARDGSGTLDVAIAVVINIDPPTYLLSADTVITVSLSGGNATRRSMNIVCVQLQSIYA